MSVGRAVERLTVLDDVLAESKVAVLMDIGEELRHVLYHVRDPEYYAYLRDNVAAPSSSDEPQ